MLKLCILLPRAKVGGSYVFLRHFQDYLTRAGIAWTNNPDDEYNILFFNSWTVSYSQVLGLKKARPDLRIIQRVDGAAQDYGRKDGADWVQRALNTLADLTIFQSQYSYQATYERYRVVRTAGPMIYNPVDGEHFRPDGPRLDLPSHTRRLISVGWSKNLLKGTWRIPQLAAQNPDVEFVVVGQTGWDSSVPPNIRALGVLPHEHLPEALRSADAYLSLIENDACPNVILEALACGLPVLYVPSGGVPELVRDAGRHFRDDAEFRPTLESLFQQRPALSARAREIAIHHHHPDVIFPAYLQAIENSHRQPIPPYPTRAQSYFDVAAFALRQEAPKWRRILTGKQPLRKVK